MEFIIRTLLSFALTTYHQTARLLSYDPQFKLVSIFFGILFCFCGARFGYLIVIVEAYRFTWGYDAMISYIRKLNSDFETFVRRNNEDNNVDADGDGIMDVLQISNRELIVRKALLLLRTVSPETVSKAASNVPIGVLVIIGVLKMDIAKTIILGSSIGDIINVPYLIPFTMRAFNIPESFRDWTALGLQTVVKAIVLMLVWFVHPIIFALHSALFGAMLCSSHLLSVVVTYLRRSWKVAISLDSNVIHKLAGYALAVIGLYFQLYGSFYAVARFIFSNRIFLFTLGTLALGYVVYPFLPRTAVAVVVEEEDIPDQFICPISRDVMVDPVITTAGHTYERAVIQEWLASHNIDPMAHIAISRTLTPNIALRQSIEKFLARRNNTNN